MSDTTSSNNIILTLGRARVRGQTTSVVGAHIGVPLVAVDLVTDGGGAYVDIDPPLSGVVQIGDVYNLRLLGDVALLDSRPVLDPNAVQTLRIPRGRLHSDRVNQLLYDVVRGSSNIGTSLVLDMLYNRVRPGLKDRLTVPEGHSELELVLPDAIRNGVGSDFVSAQICFSYPYCRAYDHITLKCNGEITDVYVDKDDAPQPPDPGSEVVIIVCFTVGRDYLERAKRLDKKLNFSWTATDQLGNGPDTDAPWSAVKTVDEDLDGTRLPMAILLERMEDFPGDDASIIDLEKLASRPLLVVILTTEPRFAVGYDVVATYTAKLTGQPVDVVVVVRGKVEADQFGQKKTCILEVPNNKILAGSSVSVIYELRKPEGDLVGTSIVATAQVTGAAPIDLVPPFPVPPAVSPIDLLTYTKGFPVRIDYPAAQKSDRARLAEKNAPEDAEKFPLVEFNGNNRVNQVLTFEFLIARIAKSFELFWILNRNGGQAAKSALRTYSVSKVTDGDTRLPAPVIAGNTGQELEVENLVTSDKLTVAPWLGKQPGQTMWVKYSGIDYQGNLIVKTDFLGAVDLPDTEISVPIALAWLKTLRNNELLNVIFKVGFANSHDEAESTSFPLRRYIVKRSTVFEDFEAVPAQPINLNQSLTLRSGLVITVLSRGKDSFIHDDPFLMFGRLYLLVGSRSIVRVAAPGRVLKSISFKYYATNQPGNSVAIYNTAGGLIARVALMVTVHPVLDFYYESSAGIGRFEVTSTETTDLGMGIDNIELSY